MARHSRFFLWIKRWSRLISGCLTKQERLQVFGRGGGPMASRLLLGRRVPSGKSALERTLSLDKSSNIIGTFSQGRAAMRCLSIISQSGKPLWVASPPRPPGEASLQPPSPSLLLHPGSLPPAAPPSQPGVTCPSLPWEPKQHCLLLPPLQPPLGPTYLHQLSRLLRVVLPHHQRP